MTREQAEALVKKHGSKAAAARAANMSRRSFGRVFDGVTSRSGKVKEEPEPDVKANDIGISLRNASVYCQQPQGRAKKLIFALPKGQGFPIRDLAKKWHISETTLAKHAKLYDAVRFVEAEPGQYVKCILHPETAEKYGE